MISPPVLQRCRFWIKTAKVDRSQSKHTDSHAQEDTMIDYGMDFAAKSPATSWRTENDSVYDHVN